MRNLTISAKCSWTYSDPRIFVSCPALNSNQIEHIWWSSATYMVEHQVIFRNFCMDIKLSDSWTKQHPKCPTPTQSELTSSSGSWKRKSCLAKTEAKPMIDQTFVSTIINIYDHCMYCTVWLVFNQFFCLQGRPMRLPEHTAAVQSGVGGGDLEPGTYMYPTSL